MQILQQLIQQFMPFAQERFGFEDPPELFFKNDAENAADPLGKTAYYDPQAKSVTLFVAERHPKDILRSLAHELVHHAQNLRGDFDGVTDMSQGYAQSDPHLRNMEIEANRDGSMCLRDFEDGLKKEGTIYYEHLQKGDKSNMSTKDWKNKEIKALMTEKWGFTCDLDMLTEKRGRGRGPNPGQRPMEEYGDSGIDRGPGDESEEPGEAETRGKARSKRELDDMPAGLGAGAAEADQARQQGRRFGGGSARAVQEKAAMDKGDQGGEDYKGFKDTDPGYKAKRRGDSHGDQGGKDFMKEDSGEDEAWHEWKNEHADDDHIKEIERHLRALKDDRNYEEHKARDDGDYYEDEGMHEDKDYTAKKEKPGADMRKGAEKRGAEATKKKTSGKGRGEKKGDDAYVNEVKVRRMVRKAIQETLKGRKTTTRRTRRTKKTRR